MNKHLIQFLITLAAVFFAMMFFAEYQERQMKLRGVQQPTIQG